jgi:tRNA pseudouridine38-40 synthase
MRIALGVEYNGSDYHGWQTQTGLATVQATLEIALAKIANAPIKVFCAGRTDTGVHATGQVVHFDTNVIRSQRAWIIGTNTHLPPSICVRWAEEVSTEFHARFSALYRRYRYIIYNHSIRSAIFAAAATCHHYPLDMTRMQAAAAYLVGEQDFSSFRSSNCEAKTAIRNIHHVEINQHGNFIMIEITANAFLHHMVRNITGVLIRVGAGLIEPKAMQEIIQAKERRSAFETAPATGLYLIKVGYPAPYLFPETENTPLFLLR